MPKSLYEWLDLIEKRPGMYLVGPHFAGLQNFMCGYDIGTISNNPELGNCSDPPFYKFSAFVAVSLGGDSTTGLDFGNEAWREIDFGGPSWQGLIRNATTSDEDAFALFFKLLRAFRAGSR